MGLEEEGWEGVEEAPSSKKTSSSSTTFPLEFCAERPEDGQLDLFFLSSQRDNFR